MSVFLFLILLIFMFFLFIEYKRAKTEHFRHDLIFAISILSILGAIRFSPVSISLRDVSFNNSVELKACLNESFESKPDDFYHRSIKMLIKRWESVIANNGEYITFVVLLFDVLLFKAKKEPHELYLNSIDSIMHIYSKKCKV